MKRLLSLLLTLLPGTGHAQPPKDIREFLVQWEGYTTYVKTLSNGERVVGVGHNMAFPAPLTPGKDHYTDEELTRAFDYDLANVFRIARKGLADFDSLPHDVRLVTISVIWTVGPTGFMEFREYRAALNRIEKDYPAAARALAQSKWRLQVGSRRVENHVALLVKAAR